MNAYLLSKVLPVDLIPYVLEFRVRSDWKTCRIHEADLIRESMMNYNRIVQSHFEVEYWVLADNEVSQWTILVLDAYMHEVSQWTLCGLRYIVYWLNNGGIDQYGRPPRIRPLERYHRSGDNYLKWYRQSFMCAFEGI